MFLAIITTILLSIAVSCSDNTLDSAPAEATPHYTLPTATLNLKGTTFTVELAYTRQSRQTGLMLRNHLARDYGMLFVFSNSKVRSFIMDNCLVDLDIAFIRADGKIACVTTMRKPTPGHRSLRYSSRFPVKYALELPAGTIKNLGLKVGDTLEFSRRIKSIIPEPEY